MQVRAVAATVLIAAAGLAAAQEPYVEASVDSTEVPVESRFWIHIEAHGQEVEWPALPEIDGLWVNPRPNTSEHMVISNRSRRHIAKLSYSAIALEPGPITIPPIRVMVNGKPMYTEPIEIRAVGQPATSPRSIANVRAWVDDGHIVKGQPFWLNIEASGGDVRMPESISVDGLSIDNVNVRRGRSVSLGRGVYSETLKNAYHCTPHRAGEIEVPAFPVQVDGKTVETEPFTITVYEQRPRQTVDLDADANELTRDDLVFINMEVDKTEVYQGEPLLLQAQLWRIAHRYVQSGPIRGSLIVPPSTEGFYVTYLEPLSYVDEHKGWKYDVSEERKVLYPTAIGDLRIGQWHWEGIALVHSGYASRPRRLTYSLNAGPIKIKVKPLPPRPAGFNGAVGQFEMNASFNTQSLKQGVPARLVVTVTGTGNPDAIGGPAIPDLPWAQVSEPERKTDLEVSAQRPYPTVTKRFTYQIVPLRSGMVTLPEIKFIHFDPETGQYETQTAGPFSGMVEAMPGVPEEVVIAAENQPRLRNVEIQSDDIMPVARKISNLSPARSVPWLPAAVAVSPVLAFAFAAVVAARRARFARDGAYARSVRAHRTALAALDRCRDAGNPAEALFQAVVQYVADAYRREAAGLTSSDVRELLEANAVDPQIVDNGARILRSCERVNYAGQDLTADEWRALESGAREFIDRLEEARRP